MNAFVTKKVWSCCALIPDNPEARSLHKFTYNMDRDALTYGWELCDEVVQVAHAILTSLPESGLLLEEHR